MIAQYIRSNHSTLGLSSLIILVLLALTSCDYYNSPYPITEKGESAINKEILGRWVKMSQDEKMDSLLLPESELSFYLWDENHFLVTEKKFKDKSIILSSVDEPRRIWNSLIDSFEFINCHYLGEDSVYHIYQYQITNDTLKFKYLTDSLKYVAQSTDDFHSFITNNLDTFLTCFSSHKSYVRWDSLRWPIVNPIEITSIYRINLLPENQSGLSQDSLGKLKLMAIDSFEVMEISELLKNKNNPKENIDSLIFDFQNYHLTNGVFSEEASPDWEDSATMDFFIVENAKGHFIKLFKLEEGMRDLTHELIFLKVSKPKNTLAK